MPQKKVETKNTKTTTAKKSTTKKTGTAGAKKTTAKKVEPVNAIEKILTPDNNDNVILYNDKNEPIEFEQIALIPYQENLYCILSPAEEIEGVEEDEAVVFKVQEENGDIWLDIVDDDTIIDAVFDVYDELYDEASKGQE